MINDNATAEKQVEWKIGQHFQADLIKHFAVFI